MLSQLNILAENTLTLSILSFFFQAQKDKKVRYTEHTRYTSREYPNTKKVISVDICILPSIMGMLTFFFGQINSNVTLQQFCII